MTKRELVIQVAERLGYTQHEVANVVQATLDAIIDCLIEGNRLEIRNFGVFDVKTRDPRKGRNPRTGQEVDISEKRVATFKPGKALKELVEGGVDAAEDAPAASQASEGSVDEQPAPAFPSPPRMSDEGGGLPSM